MSTHFTGYEAVAFDWLMDAGYKCVVYDNQSAMIWWRTMISKSTVNATIWQLKNYPLNMWHSPDAKPPYTAVRREQTEVLFKEIQVELDNPTVVHRNWSISFETEQAWTNYPATTH